MNDMDEWEQPSPSMTPEEPSVPEWDAADPYGSFHRCAVCLHQQAQFIIVKRGYHPEGIFTFRAEGPAFLVELPFAERDRMLTEVRQRIKSMTDIIGLVHIGEILQLRIPIQSNNSNNSNDGNDSNIPVHHAQETGNDLCPEPQFPALLTSLQGRDGSRRTWVDPIIRNATTRAVTLGEGFEVGRIIDGLGDLLE